MINILVAASGNNVIGNDNKLIWNIPEDMKWFKFLTTGNTIIMGRKTHESIGKALPKRQNIIISRNPEFKCKNCIVVSTLEDAIYKSDNRTDIFIIGGGQIYNKALELDIVDRIYLTRIHHRFEGDTYFNFDMYESKFEVIERDDRNGEKYDFSFITLDRIKNG